MNENAIPIVPLVTGIDEIEADPSVFSKVIGQKEACNKLAFFVESHSPATPFPTMLLTGAPGLGKTFASGKVAEALGRELVEVNCGTYDTTNAFVEGVLMSMVMGDNPKTILLDEAHKLSSEVTTILLTLLNPNESCRNYLRYKNWILEYDFSKINVIFSTTDAHKMFKPLLNRCVEVYFHSYSEAELYRILKSYLPKVKIDTSRTDISCACRGRARDAFVLAQHIKRYTAMRDTNVLDEKGWKELKGVFGIYPHGLNSQEIQLLKILKKHAPLSCRNLAIHMKVNERNIESELEVHPRSLGFIESGPKGRRLTKEGKTYLTSITVNK